MSIQTPPETTATRLYVLTDGDGRQEKSNVFARPWDLAGALATGTPVEQSFPLEASTRLGKLLEFTAWPMRVYEIEGRPLEETRWSEKRLARATVVRQLEPTVMFGPDGAHVAALLDRCAALKDAHHAERIVDDLTTAWQAAHPGEDAPMSRRHDDPPHPTEEVAWASAVAYRTANHSMDVWGVRWFSRYAQRAVRDAVEALAARHLIGTGAFTRQRYDELTGPVRAVLGPIHPKDPDAAAPAADLTPQFTETVTIGGATIRLVLAGEELTVAVDDPGSAVQRVQVKGAPGA